MFLVFFTAIFLEAAGKPELEDLMKDNRKAFSIIEKGIAKGKFEGLPEQAQGMIDRADLIAKDYEPPANKDQIAAFRALSLRMAENSKNLKTGLEKKDPAESKRLLKDLEKTCISCHKTFVPRKKR